VSWTDSFSALRHARFRRVWAAGLVSSTGDWMQIIGRSYLAYLVTGKAESVGVVYFATYAPQLFFNLWGGVLADRFDRRRLLIATQWAAAAGSFVLGVLVTTDSADVTSIAIVSFFLGVAQMLSIPAMQALQPAVVPRSALTSAISLGTTTNSVARVIGPLVAALVIGSVGVEWVFWANAVSFFAVIVAWFATPVDRQEPMAESRSMEAIRTAVRYVRTTPSVAVPIGASAFLMTIGVVYQPLAVVYATKVLAHGVKSTGSDYYGWYQAAIGVGAAIGILASASVARRRPGATFVVTAIAFSSTLAALGLVTSLGPALAVVLLVGAFHFANMALALNVVQHEVPDAMRGRVMAIHMTGLVGVVPITALAGGWLADAVGIGATFVGAGVLCGAFSLLLLRWQRHIRLVEAEPERDDGVTTALGVLVEDEA
jgi:MFS family permease